MTSLDPVVTMAITCFRIHDIWNDVWKWLDCVGQMSVIQKRAGEQRVLV